MKKTIALGLTVLLMFGASRPVLAEEISMLGDLICPSGLFLEQDGTLLITDLHGKTIQSQKAGINTRLTGVEKIIGLSGVPVGGYRDGIPEVALFESPWAIAPYGSGYAVTDTENHVLRYCDKTKVSTLAGVKTPGLKDGQGAAALFNRPTGLAADGLGNLYVADTGNHVIRKVDSQGQVTTYAGSAAGNAEGTLLTAKFCEPTGLYFIDDILYVADSGNHRICKIEKGQVTTLAGKAQNQESDSFYEGGYLDAPADSAEFSAPQGVAVRNGIVYVADTGNGVLRKLEDGVVSTILVRNSLTELYPVSPRGMVFGKEELFVGDVFANRVFSISVPPEEPKPEKPKEPVVPTNPEKPTPPTEPTSPTEPSEPIEPVAPSNPEAVVPSVILYRVQPRDTLWEIARNYKCTIAELVTLNGISNRNLIFIGQVIQIPIK